MHLTQYRNIKQLKYIFTIIFLYLLISQQISAQNKPDTFYNALATQRILNMLKQGKAPFYTVQLSFFYNTGLMDAAGNDNTIFHKEDFIGGRNFGTRYGIGAFLVNKFSLHKAGNVRLLVSAGYNRFQSDLIISKSPSGNVTYNIYSWSLGLENNFTPERKFKTFIAFDLIGSLFNGKASLATDSTDFNLTIKNSFRLGVGLILGFEYAFDNFVGVNLGMKLSNLNLLLKDSKESTNSSETYIMDATVTPSLPYSGWKQFMYYSFYGGFNFYLGMKNKK